MTFKLTRSRVIENSADALAVQRGIVIDFTNTQGDLGDRINLDHIQTI
jgi:hypothetical protein